MTQPEPLLTVQQVAVWLGLTEKALRMLVSRKAIPVRRVGRQLRFDRAEVDAWTKSSRDPSAPPAALEADRQRRTTTRSGSLAAELKSLGYR